MRDTFLKKIELEEWAHVSCPIHQMLAMIAVLTSFYDHLLKESESEQLRLR